MLPRCDKDIFNNGKCVFITHTLASEDVERFVKAVSILCDIPVDWHYMGGRAMVLTTGDTEIVEDVIEKLLPVHDRMFKKALKKMELEYMADNPPCWFPLRTKL